MSKARIVEGQIRSREEPLINSILLSEFYGLLLLQVLKSFSPFSPAFIGPPNGNASGCYHKCASFVFVYHLKFLPS